MPLSIDRRPRESRQVAVNDPELIEAIPREPSCVPDESFWAETGKSYALPAEYPAIGFPHLQSRVDRGEQLLCRSLLWIDDPKITGRDDDRVALVGVNGYSLEPTESRLEIPHPRSPLGLELDDSSLTSEAAPFGRERGR